MAAYKYVLRYGSVARYIESDNSITKGNVVRIIRVADDRAATNGFGIRPEDMIPMVVADYAIEFHERIDGGMEKVHVLMLVPPHPRAD